MDVPNLITEAEDALRKADPLCTSGDTYYAETKLLIEQTTVLWARILFLHTAQQDQLQIIGNVCLVSHSGVEKTSIQCQQKIKLLKKCRNELRALLADLKATEVDPAFKGNANLFDYIHEDSTVMLEKRVDDLVDELKSKLGLIDSVPVKIQQKLVQLRSQAPSLPAALDSETLRKLNKLSDKSGVMVGEMADTLTSLTNNYDLCSQIPSLSEEDAQEATQVALGDRQHVIEAIEQLKASTNRLRLKYTESQRLQHSLAMAFEQFITYDNSISEFIQTELRPCLILMNDESAKCGSIFTQIDEIAAEISGLSEYYRLFMKSYDALVLEVNRRHESQKQLQKLIDNANNALKGFRQRELDSRAEFLNTYREYIPEELWTGMADLPGEYSVEHVAEDLPKLSNASLSQAQKLT